MDTDDLRIRRWGDIGGDYLGPAFHMRFKPGQVLYGSRRTYLRKVAVADFEGICANTTFVFESKDPTVLLPELLPFIMQTEAFHDHSIKQSKGSVNPYVNFSDLAGTSSPCRRWRSSDGLRRCFDSMASARMRCFKQRTSKYLTGYGDESVIDSLQCVSVWPDDPNGHRQHESEWPVHRGTTSTHWTTVSGIHAR